MTTVKPKIEHPAAWRDAIVVVIATLLCGLLAVYFELSETVFTWTRDWEHWQIDELQVMLVVFVAGLAWFAWRRYRHAREEIAHRHAAERRLEQLLAENRRLMQQVLTVQESERKSLARELHDELGQYLNAIKLDAVGIQRDPGLSLSGRQAASAIVRHVDHVSEVVRERIGKLRPTGLDELGLEAALEHCIDGWRRRLPQVEFHLSVEGNLDRVDEPVALTLYRLVQEGLTNVSRHSRARRVEIALRRTQDATGADEIMFRIDDDGCGANLSGTVSGFGLISMRERVEMLGGRLEIATAPGRGFQVRAAVPAVAAA
jgi:two-component system sensor histidine kinase UhpB